MKNIYKITKGQLIAMWIFGGIGFFLALDQSDYSGFATFLAVLIPALLVFYTIGWRVSNKKEGENNKQKFNISSLIPSKTNLIIIGLIIILAFIIFGIFYTLNTNKKNLEMKQEYDQAISKVDLLKEQVMDCARPILEKKYKEEVRNCNLLKEKIKAEYNFCVSTDYRESRSVCLFENDYEKIDCSEEIIKKQSESKINDYDFSKECRDIIGELKSVNSIIESYSKLNIEK